MNRLTQLISRAGQSLDHELKNTLKNPNQDTVAAARGLTFFSSPTLLPYALEFPFARIKYRLDTIPLDALA